jgi:hypothetical protein
MPNAGIQAEQKKQIEVQIEFRRSFKFRADPKNKLETGVKLKFSDGSSELVKSATSSSACINTLKRDSNPKTESPIISEIIYSRIFRHPYYIFTEDTRISHPKNSANYRLFDQQMTDVGLPPE